MGPLDKQERADRISRSPVGSRYDKSLDRESAYEELQKRALVDAEREAEEARQIEDERAQKRQSRSAGSPRQSAGEALGKSAA